jgi:hypothetical protein
MFEEQDSNDFGNEAGRKTREKLKLALSKFFKRSERGRY